MKERQNGTLSNFFVEIIIVILFFSLATVIISKMFVSSAYTNKINKMRTMSINNANSILEVYKITDNIDECLTLVLDGKYQHSEDGKSCIIKLDEHMKYDEQGDIKLVILEEIEKKKAGICKIINLKYVYGNREIYVIEGKKYEKK